jgi:hypothetical protein
MAEASTTPIVPSAPEEWRAIPGYEGLYEASSHGRIRTLRFRNGCRNVLLAEPRQLRLCMANRYLIVGLYDVAKRRRTALVHVAVAAAFHGPRPPGMQAAHLDGNKLNNCAANIGYATPRENTQHKKTHLTQPRGERCYNCKLTDADVEEIRRIWRPRSDTGTTALARRYGVWPGTISAVVYGRLRPVTSNGSQPPRRPIRRGERSSGRDQRVATEPG